MKLTANVAHYLLAAMLLIVTVITSTSTIPSTLSHTAGLSTEASTTAITPPALPSMPKLPLLFMENRGQVDSSIAYYVKTGGQTIYLTSEGIVFDLVRYKDSKVENPIERAIKSLEPRQAERFAFSLDFIGAAASPVIEGRNMAPGKANYLIGNDPEKWHADISLYTEVVYRDIYPSIDLRLYDDGAGLRYDFIVNPGGNPADIALAYNGIDTLTVDGEELVASTAFGELRQSRPVIYQENAVDKMAVDGGFLLAGNSYGFRVASYNTELPLIIDPAIAYSTYFGGTGGEYANSVALDGNYAYITGLTTGGTFPVKTGSYDILYNAGGHDAFVAKIDTSLSGATSLIYCTYLGGNGEDQGHDIGVLSGEAYVVGITDSTNFPCVNTTPAGTSKAGYNDFFVTRFNSAGSALLCSRYVGGWDQEYNPAIYVYDSNYVLICGSTFSITSMPVSEAYQSTGGGGLDAYIARIDMTNGTVGWGSYFGGSNWDWGMDVAMSSNNCPVLLGYTPGTGFPARTTGAYQINYGGGNNDAFLVRFNGFPSGGIVYHTFLGGSDSENANGLYVQGTTAYIAGTTYSSDFPTTVSAYQPADLSSSQPNGFVTVLGMSGGGASDLKYSSYYSYTNSSISEIKSLAVSSAVGYLHMWVTGFVQGWWSGIPTKNAFQGTRGAGEFEAFVAGFDPNLPGNSSLLMSSYLGGDGNDAGYGIATSSSRVCVAGLTTSTNFNTTNGYQTTRPGSDDAFVTAITGVYPEIGVSPTSKDYGSIPVGSTSTQTFTVSNTGTGPLSIGTVTLGGTNANQFSILNDNCSGQDIAASSSRTFQVRFNPIATGSKTAYARITNSDADESVLDVNLSGTATAAPGITVNPTSGLTTTEAGGTATFTIVLTTQPTANVTIGLSSNDTTEGTVSPANVTFTSANWSTAQTVTVTGQNDDSDDDNITYTIVTAAATSTDANYSGRNASDVSVTNTDNDTASFAITPTSGLTTTEAGGTATFTVKLNTQPAANVALSLSTSDSTEGSMLPTSLTFTSANWNTNQTVTITGQNDFLVDGNVAYSITTNTASSTDPKYNGLNPTDVSATNTDNDTAGFTVNPTSGLTTTEGGGTATFTVKLTSQPTADVSIVLSSNDTTEGTVSPASLTFTASNWNTNQTVTVTGANDNLDDGNIGYTIVTAAATSSDSNYSGRNPSDVTVTNTDNDTAGVLVTPTSGLVTTENLGTATFTVKLTSEPTGNVTIGLSSTNTGEGTVSLASLTFTNTNWNTSQVVTVTGVDDAPPAMDGNILYTITTAPASSTDSSYNNLNPSDVSVTNNDNDQAGISVNPTSGLTTTESGGTATFTVVLNTQPTADVTIGISSSNTAEGTVLPASLTFTNANWNTTQTVTVTGVDDITPVMDGNISYTITTAPASSTDGSYNNLNADNVSVTNNDNDTAGFTVTPTSGLTTSEAGGTTTFTVVLNTQPTADVTIGISSSNTGEGTVLPATLTFTNNNWNSAQTVTVTGVNDSIADGSVAYTIITAAATSSDSNYNTLDPADVSVTNTDNDTAGFTITPTSGLVTTEAGGTATFTVVLNTQPTDTVTLGLGSSDTTEGTVSPSILTFTTANWSTPQTVTVTGVDDLIVDGNIAYTIATDAAISSDTSYNGIDPSDVSVTNNDNETPGITVNPTSGLITAENGGTDTFTVVLNTEPTANVTLTLSSSDATEGTVTPTSLTFTPSDWFTPQTVTVTGLDDTTVDGAVTYTIITAAATSTDASYNGVNASDVTVVNHDNDVNCSNGTGMATFAPNTGTITGLTAPTQILCSTTGKNFPFGLFSYTITGIPAGATVVITITLPSNIPAGTEYWKCINGSWVNVTSLLGDNNGDNILTLTITDGGTGDADGVGNGTITDPGGPVGAGVLAPPVTNKPKTQLPSSSSSAPQVADRFVPSSAKLAVKYLNVQPQQVKINEPVTVYANITNGGDESGTYEAILKINGKIEEVKTGKVGGHAAVPLKFTLIPDEPGGYTVDINGQQTFFTVVGKKSNAAPSNLIWLIGFILCALGVLIVSTLLILRRRTI